MKLRDIFYPLLKWWWLILIATVIAAVSSYVVTKPQPPIYRAQTTLVVGSAQNVANPSGSSLGISVDLATYYAQIAQREPVKDATMAALGLSKLPVFTVDSVPDTQLIQISVTDISPQRAAAVANELANQLIKQSPSGSQSQVQQRQSFVNQQLDDLQKQIQQTTQDLAQKQMALQGLNSAVQIADAQAEINALETKLQLLQTNYATLLSNTTYGAINTLSVIEVASVPKIPIGPNKPVIILLVAVIGFLLSSGTAHLLEYLDRTLKTPEDVQNALQLPVLGYIADLGKNDNWNYVSEQPRSPVAEAFRALRNNIEFSGVDRPIKNILITSTGTAEGKTTVATNLAMIMGQGDKKVVLLDADLRRPNVHELLKIPIAPGLGDIFRDRLSVQDAIRAMKEKHVSLITAGNPPPNPAELLGSQRMDQVLKSLDQMADVVIVDGPPSLVTDSIVLGKKVDAVLLVIRPGQTRDDVAKAALEQMRRAGANVIGVVMNRIPKHTARSYAGYQAYSPYYSETSYFDDTTNQPPAELNDTKQIFPHAKEAE